MPTDPPPDTAPVHCPRCKRTLEGFVFVQIGSVKNLFVGRFLVVSTTGNCMDCGQKFQWNMNESKLEEFAVTVGKVRDRMYVGE